MKPISRTVRKVAVIIPCYNEAESIGEVIGKFTTVQRKRPDLAIGIYVIDNNSTDNTDEIARKAGAVVIREPEKGKGNALRTGFQNIPDDVDYVVMLDGDDTYSPEELPRIIEPLECDFCDVVIGSRLGGRIQTLAMSRVNRLGNKLFTLAVRVLYRVNVSDVLSGYFAWKKPALDEVAPYITSAGFAIEMEMITKMARLDQQLASVPISYHPRTGASHLRPLRDGARILLMLVKNMLWHPTGRLLASKASLVVPSQPTLNDFVPRRLVFVSDAIYPYMKGGKEKRMHEITKRLAAMGHDVHIYTMHWWREEDSAKTRWEDGVQLHALSKYYPLYQGNHRSIKEGVMFGLACFKLIGVRFDVLDVDHMPFFPIFSAWIVCRLRGRKLYATWHEALSRQEWVNYMGPSGVIAALIERLTVRLPHYITAASEHTHQLLRSAHGRTKRVGLVSSGVDTSLLSTIRSAPVTCDVLYVGRLVKDKNVDLLIQAMERIVKLQPQARCLIVGDGPEKVRLERLVKRRKLSKNILFMGALADAKDVYAYMKAAKVFCSPSTREGFGITVLESLACGTPVVTVDSPKNAARHLIQDGQNGSVVPLIPGQLAAALNQWLSLAERPDTAATLAQYDWHQLAKKQAEVYSL